MAEDFSGQNLRGRSFKGHDLTGANFTGADIRGANFKGACLAGAVFTDVKAGLSRRFQIVLSFFSIIGCALVGESSGFGSLFILGWLNKLIYISDTNPSPRLGEIILVGMVLCVIFLICLKVALRKKLFYKVLPLFIIAETSGVVFSVLGAALVFAQAWGGVFAWALGWALALTGFLTFALGWAWIGAVVLAFAGIFAGVFAWALAGATAVAVTVVVALGLSPG